jgi:hypothetical protein
LIRAGVLLDCADSRSYQVISVFIVKWNEMASCRMNCQSGWRAMIWAGVMAGVISTLIQILLWLIFTDDFPSILYRDARLTAAMVLGGSVLPPPATFDVGVMLTATLIHFMLSIAYAALLALAAARLDTIPALLAGVGFGAALYAVNIYGFTAIFPWFAQTRGWITLIAHVVFGLTAISVYQWLEISNVRSQPEVH